MRIENVDVIIPVYKPKETLILLLRQLSRQTNPVHKIILINTEKNFFDSFFEKLNNEEREWFYQKQKEEFIVLKHITKKDFDHGATRNLGVSMSLSSFFVCMTDDAVPENDNLIENLLSPFTDAAVAMTYARQLPNADCGVIESFTREFNYPVQSSRKSASDLKILGIKAFFASNVCAAYRRSVFDELGGFTKKTIFNEDMIFARGVLNTGLCICYVADACVYHSHNYSGVEQFHRNFDLGISHALYPNVFSRLATESEGIKMVKTTCSYLCKKGKPWLIVKLFWQSGCKYAGFFLGKRYRRLPIKFVKCFSMNKDFFNS